MSKPVINVLDAFYTVREMFHKKLLGVFLHGNRCMNSYAEIGHRYHRCALGASLPDDLMEKILSIEGLNRHMEVVGPFNHLRLLQLYHDNITSLECGTEEERQVRRVWGRHEYIIWVDGCIAAMKNNRDIPVFESNYKTRPFKLNA